MSLPKYEEISNEIRKRIFEGIYPLDKPIPDEVSLAKEFGCSRMTMKKALEVLVLEGLLYRKRGLGTFILKSAIEEDRVNVLSKETKGLTAVAKGKSVTSKVIEFSVQFPSKEIVNLLAIETTSPIYKIIRVRFVDGEPYVIEKTYMPVEIIKGLTDEILQGSVYDYIQNHLKLTIASAHKKIRADKPIDLDKQYLNCSNEDPILEVEQVVYLSSGQPFEYSFARHRYDKFVFTTYHINKG